MQASRRLLSPSAGLGLGSLQNKLLLPPPSLIETSSAALSGVWAVLSDQSYRDQYEHAIQERIIQDEVLSRASNGSILVYSLFHNLYQDSLFADNRFQAKDFVRAATSALENYHDTLGRLQNNLKTSTSDDPSQEETTIKERLKQSDDEILSSLKTTSVTEAFLGANAWRNEADKDPESLAAYFSNMSSPACFDVCYYTSKLAASFSTSGASFVKCSVNDVALLRARAKIIPPKDDADTVGEFKEFRATDELHKTLNVAAQLDVLYEITSTHKTMPDDGDKDSSKATAETITTTNLAVAVFEGWLSGGPEKDLRWKIGLLREAVEFPDHVATIERQ